MIELESNITRVYNNWTSHKNAMMIYVCRQICFLIAYLIPKYLLQIMGSDFQNLRVRVKIRDKNISC